MTLLGAADSTSIDACTKVVRQVGDTILAPAMCHAPQRVNEVWKIHILCHPPVGDDAHSPPREISTDFKPTPPKKTIIDSLFCCGAPTMGFYKFTCPII